MQEKGLSRAILADHEADGRAAVFDAFDVLRKGFYLATTTDLYYMDVGLQPETLYTYEVAGVNIHGDSPSDQDSATTTAAPTNPPPTPTGLTSTATYTTAIELTWAEAMDATSYLVRRDGTHVTIRLPRSRVRLRSIDGSVDAWFDARKSFQAGSASPAIDETVKPNDRPAAAQPA